MSLDDWLTNRWVHGHQTSPEEIQALLHSAEEDLRSAQVPGIAAGWRLNMAYSAALRYARAALYAKGYRPGREREHERTIDSLTYTTLSVEPNTITVLHKIRKMRHVATYDSVEMISEEEADAAMELARDLGSIVIAYLKSAYPQLLD